MSVQDNDATDDNISELTSRITTNIDTIVLDAVTATGASSFEDVLDIGKLTIMVVAVGATVSGVIKVQGSPDGTSANCADISTFAAGALTAAASQTISAAGTTIFTIDTRVVTKHARVDLVHTNGTFTVYMFGRPS